MKREKEAKRKDSTEKMKNYSSYPLKRKSFDKNLFIMIVESGS